MPLAWVAAEGIPKIGAGSHWMGSRLHHGEEEEEGEEENSIPRAQPALGGKSVHGVWEQGEFGALHPTFCFVHLSLHYEGENSRDASLNFYLFNFSFNFSLFKTFFFSPGSIEYFSMRQLAKRFLGRCDGS